MMHIIPLPINSFSYATWYLQQLYTNAKVEKLVKYKTTAPTTTATTTTITTTTTTTTTTAAKKACYYDYY